MVSSNLAGLDLAVKSEREILVDHLGAGDSNRASIEVHHFKTNCF